MFVPLHWPNNCTYCTFEAHVQCKPPKLSPRGLRLSLCSWPEVLLAHTVVLFMCTVLSVVRPPQHVLCVKFLLCVWQFLKRAGEATGRIRHMSSLVAISFRSWFISPTLSIYNLEILFELVILRRELIAILSI